LNAPIGGTAKAMPFQNPIMKQLLGNLTSINKKTKILAFKTRL
jgi:hypothetical protein